MNTCSVCRLAKKLKYRGVCAACYERRRKQLNPEHERELARRRCARYREANSIDMNRRERVRRTSSVEHLERRRAIERASYRARRLRLLDRAHQAKAMALGRISEAIDWKSIHDRDCGVCQLCNRPVILEEMSLDHIVALTNGGDHVLQNVQTAHRTCNLSKNNRQQQPPDYYERLSRLHEMSQETR